VEYANSKTYNVFKYSEDELINGNLAMLISPHYRQKHQSQVDNFFKNNEREILSRSVMGFNKNDNQI